MNMEKQLKINKEACKGCGLCIGVCPDKALEFDKSYNSKGVHPIKLNKRYESQTSINEAELQTTEVNGKENKKCRLCGQCYLICPDSAVEIINEEVVER